mmetsp:Transcript_9149/g.13528  ORF Transcript_9149/g.13528 Transcript_9149/m.13528 type:complete len:205 (+) Transcript_9149:41-655(+)
MVDPKKGWLMKKGGSRFTSKKKRWFVLTDDALSYFDGKEEKKQLGSIPLGEVKECVLTGESFNIETGYRSYCCYASSIEEAVSWAEDIENRSKELKNVNTDMEKLKKQKAKRLRANKQKERKISDLTSRIEELEEENDKLKQQLSAAIANGGQATAEASELVSTSYKAKYESLLEVVQELKDSSQKQYYLIHDTLVSEGIIEDD